MDEKRKWIAMPLTNTDPEAVAAGIRDALLTVVEDNGLYPQTRDDILNAIREGVADAFARFLETQV